jgi:hypothetical protein
MRKGTKLNTAFYMKKIVEAAGQQYRIPLIDCFNAFDKGPLRTVMFVMFLNDVRQIHSATATPAGEAKPRLDPSKLSSADAADIFLNLRNCFAPEFLDTELSVFMQRLRVQGAAGAPGLV